MEYLCCFHEIIAERNNFFPKNTMSMAIIELFVAYHNGFSWWASEKFSSISKIFEHIILSRIYNDVRTTQLRYPFRKIFHMGRQIYAFFSVISKIDGPWASVRYSNNLMKFLWDKLEGHGKRIKTTHHG